MTMRCVLSEHFSIILDIKEYVDSRLVMVTCDYSAIEETKAGKVLGEQKV